MSWIFQGDSCCDSTSDSPDGGGNNEGWWWRPEADKVEIELLYDAYRNSEQQHAYTHRRVDGPRIWLPGCFSEWERIMVYDGEDRGWCNTLTCYEGLDACFCLPYKQVYCLYNMEHCGCCGIHRCEDGCGEVYASDCSLIRACDEAGEALASLHHGLSWCPYVCPGSLPMIVLCGLMPIFDGMFVLLGACFCMCPIQWCRKRYRAGDEGEYYVSCVDPSQPPRLTRKGRCAKYEEGNRERAASKNERKEKEKAESQLRALEDAANSKKPSGISVNPAFEESEAPQQHSSPYAAGSWIWPREGYEVEHMKERRAYKVTVAPDGNGSIDFETGKSRPKEAEAKLSHVELASFPVDSWVTLLTDEDVQEHQSRFNENTGVWKPGKAYQIASAQNDQFPDTVRIKNRDVWGCRMVCNVATLQLAFIPGVSQVKLAPGEEQISLGNNSLFGNDTGYDWCDRDDWQSVWGDYDARDHGAKYKIDGRAVLTVVNTWDDRVKMRYRGRDFILDKDKVVECAAETFGGFDDSGC